MQDSEPAHPDPDSTRQVAYGGHTAVRRATAADAAAVRDNLVDLLSVGGQTVALIEMAPAADHLLVVNVAVAPGHQGRGHGRALMAHAERVAASLGLAEVRLYTNGRFAENLRLYARLGYGVDREETHPQLGAAVYMSKRLALPRPGENAVPDHASAPPEFVAQAQLDAYNARDMDAFMRWWADDCRYHEFPGRLLASGAAEVRERHAARFREPNLHGRLVKRIAVGTLVVDQETVTRTFPVGPGEVDVVAIYEVAEGKITGAWFRMGPPRLRAVEAPAAS